MEPCSFQKLCSSPLCRLGASSTEFSPLSGANVVPIGSGRGRQRPSVFDRLFFPRKSVFDHLSFETQLLRPTFRRGGAAMAAYPVPCPRCLLPGHGRQACRWQIRCRGCRASGHVVASCPDAASTVGQLDMAIKGKAAATKHKWFKSPDVPGPSQPPRFGSFGELAKALSPSWAVSNPVPHSLQAWPKSPRAANVPLTVGPREESNQVASLEPSAWTLATPSPSSFTPQSAAEPKSPIPALQCNPPTIAAGSSSTMAFQRADPQPFVPSNMIWEDVVNRPTMVRAVASRRASVAPSSADFNPAPPLPAKNNNLAIVTIAPLPENVLDYEVVLDVLNDFCAAAGVVITDIQPCCLGQAYVRFARPLDRDVLVDQGAIPFDNAALTFVKHNEGRNWRRVFFNTECWIMLMGFPPDYQEDQFYQDAIGSFGKLLYSQKENRRLTRVIVKARVLDVQSIPHFVVFSESASLESESWTVQCEVLQHKLLGGGPPVEEAVPELPVGDGAPFDFFGLDQPGAGPQQVDQDIVQGMDQNIQLELGQGNPWEGPWDPWPDQQQQHENMNLNLEPMEIDLNGSIQHDDDNPLEEIINPDQPMNVFPGINDILDGNDVVAEAIAENNLLGDIPPLPLPEMLLTVQLEENHPGDQENILLEHLAGNNDLNLNLNPAMPTGVPALNLPDNLLEEQNPQPVLHQNLNIGLALLPHFGPDPAFADWERKKTVEATRLWADHFNTGSPHSLHVRIPNDWSNFFTVLLLSPVNYAWAKDFLASKALTLLGGKNGHIDFHLPVSCPADPRANCTYSSITEGDTAAKDTERLVSENVPLAGNQAEKQHKNPRKAAKKRPPWLILR